MRIGIGTGTAATVLLLVGTAQGGDDWKSTLAEAKTQARASEHLKAAGLFGDAFAAVQKAGDIVGEQEVDDLPGGAAGRVGDEADSAGIALDVRVVQEPGWAHSLSVGRGTANPRLCLSASRRRREEREAD